MDGKLTVNIEWGSRGMSTHGRSSRGGRGGKNARKSRRTLVEINLRVWRMYLRSIAGRTLRNRAKKVIGEKLCAPEDVGSDGEGRGKQEWVQWATVVTGEGPTSRLSLSEIE